MAKVKLNDGESETRIALVHQAFVSGISNCVEWVNDRKQREVTQDVENQGLTATEIRRLATEWIIQGGVIDERRETDPTRDRDYWYRIIINIDGFPRGLFVEIELTDPDPECPVVTLLNAHPQKEGEIIWRP